MPIDYSRYPANWKSEIVPAVLDRAGNRCEFCGLENGSEVTSIKIVVRELGNPRAKTLWFRDESDLKRALPLSTGSTKRVRVVLTVAHLDHDEENHDVKIERLRALCQLCHLRYDAEEKRRRMKAKLTNHSNRGSV